MNQTNTLKSLGIFVVLVGVVGYIRTGSVVPIIINTVIAAITWWLAARMTQKKSGAIKAIIVWLSFTTLIYAYMTVGPMMGHEEPRPFSWLLFGSMALYSVVVLILFVRKRGYSEVVE